MIQIFVDDMTLRRLRPLAAEQQCTPEVVAELAVGKAAFRPCTIRPKNRKPRPPNPDSGEIDVALTIGQAVRLRSGGPPMRVPAEVRGLHGDVAYTVTVLIGARVQTYLFREISLIADPGSVEQCDPDQLAAGAQPDIRRRGPAG